MKIQEFTTSQGYFRLKEILVSGLLWIEGNFGAKKMLTSFKNSFIFSPKFLQIQRSPQPCHKIVNDRRMIKCSLKN
jgi:hypothetical protein